MPSKLQNRVSRMAKKGTVAVLKAALFGLEVYAELLPGVRMTTQSHHLPANMGAGIIGAEAATWWALSPSLLPRTWWSTALNVSFCQAWGHLVGTLIDGAIRKTLQITRPERPELSACTQQNIHLAMGAVTGVLTALSVRRQRRQAQLVETHEMGAVTGGAVGIAVGTLGYGTLILAGEAVQHSVGELNHTLRRWLPPAASWPLAVAGVGAAVYAASDFIVVRRVFDAIARSARKLNDTVFPGVAMPMEPERSGSPLSYERWEWVGSQGQVVLSGGPRTRDIREVTRLDHAMEPIRIFIGLREGRSYEEAAAQAIAEMDRTGAFKRSNIVMMAGSGTGWLPEWSTASVEFLTGGDCAVVAIQYSYLPSAVSYAYDHDLAVESSTALIRALERRFADMSPEDRPRFFVAGESLGAYGIADSFADSGELLAHIDGAVLTGTPKFTRLRHELTAAREPGSPERLPVIDGGRHIRYAANHHHIAHTYSGAAFANEWEHPRVVMGQHASDPIAFWDGQLFLTPPDWLREPGARGVPGWETEQLDVLDDIFWMPFITGWQVGVDQLISIHFPGGHGHNYWIEVVWYWAAVLGDAAAVELTDVLASRIDGWIKANRVKRER